MSDTAPPPPRIALNLGRPAWRLVFVLCLFVALLPPQCMIGELVSEREARQEEVRQEIASAWGHAQNLMGPVLTVPVRFPDSAPGVGRGNLTILPAQLEARLVLEPETRRRGIFAAVVYRARVELRGHFLPTLPEGGEQPLIDWRDAALALAGSDLRATPADPTLAIGGRDLGAPEAAPDLNCRGLEALRWPARLETAPEPGQPVAFSGSVELRGTSSFRLLPIARRTAFAASAPWPTPSFSGANLPLRSEVTEQGFTAEWLTISRLPPSQYGFGWCAGLITQAGAGQQVALLEAVPTYRMVNRAAKYAAMILALALLTYVLFELLSKVAIHPVQYGLLGLSIVLFPLLLLAIGEPVGFDAAFALAAAMVTAQAGAHTAMVTRRPRLAGIFVASLAAMFGFVHVVLSLESYALLAGAVALFAALSVLMVVTRNVRWGGA